MSSYGGSERLTRGGKELALQAGKVIDVILHSDLGKKGGRREFRFQLLGNPPFIELRGAATSSNVVWLARELLKFYEQSLAILMAREESARTGKTQNTQEFWYAQQEIKRILLGDAYEEKKFLAIFHGLDFLAGQRVHTGSELECKRLLNAVREKAEVLRNPGNRKEPPCPVSTVQI